MDTLHYFDSHSMEVSRSLTKRKAKASGRKGLGRNSHMRRGAPGRSGAGPSLKRSLFPAASAGATNESGCWTTPTGCHTPID